MSDDTQDKTTRHRLAYFKIEHLVSIYRGKFGVFPSKFVRVILGKLPEVLFACVGYRSGVNLDGFGKIHLSKVPPRKSYCPATKTYHEHPARMRAYIQLDPDTEKALIEKWDLEMSLGQDPRSEHDQEVKSMNDTFDIALKQARDWQNKKQEKANWWKQQKLKQREEEERDKKLKGSQDNLKLEESPL